MISRRHTAGSGYGYHHTEQESSIVKDMKYIYEKTEITSSYDLRSIASLEEMLFFDIETTGLKKETTQIYLIGCGSFDADGNYEIRQWLAESALDEQEVLESFFAFAKHFTLLMHFNGDGFDIPYVAYKAGYYGYDFSFDRFESFDIYRHAKPLKKFLGLARMGQKAIEEFLKIERKDQMNGGLLIPVFYDYERTGDAYDEELLLLHNRDDVAGMLLLTEILAYSDIFEGKYSFGKCEFCRGICVLEYELENPVRVPVERHIETGGAQNGGQSGRGVHAEDVSLFKQTDTSHDGRPGCGLHAEDVPMPVQADVRQARQHGCTECTEVSEIVISVSDRLLQINIPAPEAEARIPVRNIEDYYYLPLEDRIIHKDVAEFVDRKFRKKATAKNCFLKKAGKFVPACGLEGSREYLLPGPKGKLCAQIDVNELMDADYPLRAVCMQDGQMSGEPSGEKQGCGTGTGPSSGEKQGCGMWAGPSSGEKQCCGMGAGQSEQDGSIAFAGPVKYEKYADGILKTYVR